MAYRETKFIQSEKDIDAEVAKITLEDIKGSSRSSHKYQHPHLNDINFGHASPTPSLRRGSDIGSRQQLDSLFALRKDEPWRGSNRSLNSNSSRLSMRRSTAPDISDPRYANAYSTQPRDNTNQPRRHPDPHQYGYTEDRHNRGPPRKHSDAAIGYSPSDDTYQQRPPRKHSSDVNMYKPNNKTEMNIPAIVIRTPSEKSAKQEENPRPKVEKSKHEEEKRPQNKQNPQQNKTNQKRKPPVPEQQVVTVSQTSNDIEMGGMASRNQRRNSSITSNASRGAQTIQISSAGSKIKNAFDQYFKQMIRLIVVLAFLAVVGGILYAIINGTLNNSGASDTTVSSNADSTTMSFTSSTPATTTTTTTAATGTTTPQPTTTTAGTTTTVA